MYMTGFSHSDLTLTQLSTVWWLLEYVVQFCILTGAHIYLVTTWFKRNIRYWWLFLKGLPIITGIAQAIFCSLAIRCSLHLSMLHVGCNSLQISCNMRCWSGNVFKCLFSAQLNIRYNVYMNRSARWFWPPVCTAVCLFPDFHSCNTWYIIIQLICVIPSLLLSFTTKGTMIDLCQPSSY